MPARAKLPGDDVLRKLVEQGLTDAEIGERYGASGSAVQQRRMRAKPPILRPKDPNRLGHKQYVPWRIRNAHRTDELHKILIRYSNRMQGRPALLKPDNTPSEKAERELDLWMAFMDGANEDRQQYSVYYDYQRGFWIDPRQPGDKNYIHYESGD